MEDDDIPFVFSGGSIDCYLETLARTRRYLKDSTLLSKLDEVVEIEIQLALMGSKKALADANKPKDNVRPIKGGTPDGAA